MKKWIVWSMVLTFGFLGLSWGQDQDVEAPQMDQLFVKVTIYPTASLSRYDYNNDIDLFELRAYVELREKSPTGELVSDAQVYVNSKLLQYKTDHYEKRIKVSRDAPAREIAIRINTPNDRQIQQKVVIPTWLILENPKPDIIDSEKDLEISWLYTNYGSPVDVSAYNFKSGEVITTKHDVEGNKFVIPASKIPPSTIVRVFVMQSWSFKRFLSGQALVRGSEITLIPWTQVFLRSR
jgi:hypothetical protein